MRYSRILILSRTPPATSYVASTFHPTIGQCAHQYLCNTTTPELGMISPRNKEQAGLHIAKDTQISQANTVGFIRPSRSWEKLNAKLVGSSNS